MGPISLLGVIVAVGRVRVNSGSHDSLVRS
jgi:hypothetical protein